MTDTSDLFVRAARAVLNLKQQELGELLGRSRFSIARYEDGYPLPETVKRAILHLMSERGIDMETQHICLHLPNHGRRKPSRSVAMMKQRIARYKRSMRSYPER